jgi:HAD superfamily hydrolase (TIGR01484 family)
MRYRVLACDYDGTIATSGVVDAATLGALERLKASGRRLVLVTGRKLDDLLRVFAALNIFDLVVAENGGSLYDPTTQKERALAEPPPERFVAELRARGIAPLDVGNVVVATWHPNETAVLEVIRDLGLDHQVIFNKGAVMVLPAGVNKATGLQAALEELSISVHEVVGVGDAENDHAFLAACECSVAVANALPTLKERVDLVTPADHGAGVVELIERMLADDLASLDASITRHHVALGVRRDGSQLGIKPYGLNLLVAGPSGSGKSTFATGLLERLARRTYQICVIDPEGDYEAFEALVSLGSPQRAPGLLEIEQALARGGTGLVVNLLGVPLTDRPAYFDHLLPRLLALRASTGRPHWLVVDEAHHLLPKECALMGRNLRFASTLFITVHPRMVSPAVLRQVDVLIAVGDEAEQTVRDFAETSGLTVPPDPLPGLEQREALVWFVTSEARPEPVKILPPEAELKRHGRKYAEGDLDDKAFYFRGPAGKLNLRAQNLALFVQIAEGVDDDTWLFHLRNGDVARWFRADVKDAELADEAEAVAASGASAGESRARVREAIEKRYTLSAA